MAVLFATDGGTAARLLGVRLSWIGVRRCNPRARLRSRAAFSSRKRMRGKRSRGKQCVLAQGMQLFAVAGLVVFLAMDTLLLDLLWWRGTDLLGSWSFPGMGMIRVALSITGLDGQAPMFWVWHGTRRWSCRGCFSHRSLADGALFSRIWFYQCRSRRPPRGGGVRACAGETSRSAGRLGNVPMVVSRRGHGCGAWRWRWDGRGMQMESSPESCLLPPTGL